MKFDQIRKSVVKKTMMDVGNRKLAEPATVQRISPWANGLKTELKAGIQMGDLLRPLHNRASRRASGQIKRPIRLRGNLPPHPVAVIHRANEIERAGQLARNAEMSRLAKDLGVHVTQIDEAAYMRGEYV